MMGLDRRDFLKLSAASAAALAASSPLLAALAGAELPAAASVAGVAGAAAAVARKRYAMAVDVEKCLAGKADKCIQACHAYHNVPDWRLPDGDSDGGT